MTTHQRIETYLMDMDGVLVHEERLVPGADQFIKRLQQTGHRFLVLTNNSIYTPRDLAARLTATGLQVPEESIWTSALATARFLDTQRPQGTAYVIGEAGLTTALHERGYVLSDRDPDYVVLGETRAYSTEAITRAIRLIDAGARFIATNPDPTGPSPAGLQTILVLSGITTRQEAQRFPFLPSRIVDSVADLVDDIGDEPRPAGWPPARRGILRQAAADHVGPSAPNGQPPVRAERLLNDPATTCAIATSPGS
jgi:NagD protein